MFKRILIATDGSACSEKAAHLAVELGNSIGAELIAVAVEPEYPSFLFPEYVIEDIEAAEQKYADDILAKVIAMAGRKKMRCKVQRVAHEAPYKAILETAKNMHCDLIVMGSHGRSGIAHIIIGSIAQKVLAHASLPVLIVR